MSENWLRIWIRYYNMHTSVAGIIKQDGKMLLLDRVNPPFGWAPPCGQVEDGEEMEEALKREVLEESGLGVRKAKLIHHEFLAWNECKRGVRGHDFFIYEILEWEGEVRQNYESKKIGWFSPEEMKELTLEPAWDYFLKKINI